jgi:hypothetical protein
LFDEINAVKFSPAFTFFLPIGVGFLEIWYNVDTPIPVMVSDTTNKINIPK